MQVKGYISALIRLWTISMVCHIVASCTLIWSEMNPEPQCEKGIRQTVVLNLAISHPDANINTRAALEYDDLSFTRNEAAVKSLTAFIVDLNQDGTENYNAVEYFSTELDPVDFYKGIYVFRQTIEVETGTKHIYVGANLKEEHIQAFIQNKPLSLDGEGPAINMIMTPDPTHSGQGTDIAMFGQIKTRDGSQDISITENVTDYYLSGDMERLTAKVLVTCIEGEPGLVATGGKGWVETSKIRYTLNVTNRSTFINRRIDNNSGINIDPNWNLGEWVKADVSAEGGYSPTDDHGTQFESWDSNDLMSRLWDERCSTTPLVYDASKVGQGNSENHYTAGLYCLENTACNSMGLSGSAVDNAAKVATTHIVMAVRFIPKRFVGGWGIVEPASLEDALTINLVSGGGSGPHEDGTFWTREVGGDLTYYAYTGMNKTINESNGTLTEADFTCYEGGWSYFTTFADGETSDSQLTYANMDVWGIQRDHYYILSIDHISRPGSPVPWDEFIRVNSITTKWVYKGSQDITIRPM